MNDGLYQVTTRYFCAAFEIRDVKVKASRCAPILRKKLKYWATQAVKIASVMLLCSSCTTSPTVKRGADGSYEAHAGSTFMASRTGVIAEVKTREGDHIKFVAKGEDSTKVPISFLRTAATFATGFFYTKGVEATEATAQVTAKEVTKQRASDNATKVLLGEQDVAVKTFVPPE